MMSLYALEVTALSVFLCTLYAARIPIKSSTPWSLASSESRTIKPVPCDIEMPDPLVLIYPWCGFCISLPGQNKSKRIRRMTQNCDEEAERRESITTFNLNQLETNLSSKIKKFSILYPALHVNIGRSWFVVLEREFTQPYFKNLSRFLAMERRTTIVLPPADKVWTWTQMCSIHSIKVVIIGQDPYHRPGQAHGLCFSVPNGIAPPPSLLNIYEELKNDIHGFVTPPHGNLVGWARQGVLMLNSVLTVRSHMPNSHSGKGWEQFTNSVISYLSTKTIGTVFLVWGVYAQKKAAIVNQERHHLLVAPHPSPFSAHRGFFGCKHFSRCNEILISEGKQPINWSHLPPE